MFLARTNSIPLIAIIDMGVTHSFILLDCAERLGFKLSYMVWSMIVDTPTLGLVTTSWVCLNFSLDNYGKIFGMDLVCQPLINIDVILRMNCWSSTMFISIFTTRQCHFKSLMQVMSCLCLLR